MAINQPGFASTPISEVRDVVITMLETRPIPNVELSEPLTPGTVAGYFNNRTGFVELFITSESGTQWVKIG